MTADLRNAPSGPSTGPVEVDRPWESYADDQLGLMDSLGIDKFMVMGFCIWRPLHLESFEARTQSYCRSCTGSAGGLAAGDARPKYPGHFWKSWPRQTLTAKRPEITMQTADQFVTRMFETDRLRLHSDTRFRAWLPKPDSGPAGRHSCAPIRRRHGMRLMLAPRAEVSIFPWKEPKERIPLAVRQIHSLPQGASTCLGQAAI